MQRADSPSAEACCDSDDADDSDLRGVLAMPRYVTVMMS